MKNSPNAFTIPELLIALAIMAVVTTFAIPKLLTAGGEDGTKHKRVIQEVAVIVNAAYIKYQLNNNVTSSFKLEDVVPYMDFVAEDNTSVIDKYRTGTGSRDCSVVNVNCYKMHNGAVFHGSTNNTFGQPQNDHYVYFLVDPNGVLDTTAAEDHVGKAIDMILYYDGRVKTMSACLEGDTTYESGLPQDWCPGDPASDDPSWFSWD